MSLEEKVVKVIVEQLSVTKDKVIPTAKVVDDLGADSLDVTELIMALEEEFDLKIEDSEAKDLQTVQDIYDYVNSHS